MDKDPETDTGTQNTGSGSSSVEERRAEDRRKQEEGPPFGLERRQWRDRRKIRSKEGRERYLDMVQRERTLLLDLGVSRSTDQLLDMAGAISLNPKVQQQEDEAIQHRATGDQLRSILPVQAWLPLSIHLIGLADGVLKIAPLNDLNDRQIESLMSTVRTKRFSR